jgi:solute:Na+ symporter, SSS family
MHWIDLAIIIVFLSGFSIYGLSQRSVNNSTEDYFLGGRNIPWPVAMFSIVATETSVLTFISVPGLAYRDNWFFLQLALGYIIGRILVSIILLPQYFSSDITSIYEVIGNNFGPNVQKIASGIFLITRVLADGVRFLATSVIVQVITGWSLPLSVFIIGSITLIYTLNGGIKTVAWVDTIQFVLYLFGGIISIFIAFSYLEVPLQTILLDLKSNGKLATINFYGNPLDDPYFFISAIFGGALLSFSSHGVDYMMVQRLLGTKNLAAAKKALIGSGIFVFLQFSIFLFAGSLIYLVMDGMIIERDREFTTFIINYIPIGLKGLLLAAVLSAAMSTLSSSINSLASSTVTDWLKGEYVTIYRISPSPPMSKNIGIVCLIIFVISFFIPYWSIGQVDVTLIKLATETENTDWIGVLILGIGSLMLMMGSDKNISLVLTIIGGFFPLYRFYKITFAGDFGALTPSFAIGGYLILLAVIIQLYACLSSPDTVSESANDNAASNLRSLKQSKSISFIWGIILILIALLFDEGGSAVVIVGLQIASFTYGGLLGLFLLSKFNIKFNSISLIVGLISSLLIVFYLRNIDIVWTWFIGISVLVNISFTLLTEIVINKKIVWRSN